MFRSKGPKAFIIISVIVIIIVIVVMVATGGQGAEGHWTFEF